MSAASELSEIRRTMEDALDPRSEHEEKRTGKSRLNNYEKTLRVVKKTADTDAMQGLSAWLQNQIRERGELPSSREVREEGARVCEDMGYEVAPESWLRP